jgi:hypothetical protein
MLWAMDTGLGFGMHYCSLENKHRSEMRQQNEPYRDVHPCYVFDDGDFFLKTAKVFGNDVDLARELLRAAGCRDFIENKREQSLAFAPQYAERIKASGCDVVIALNALEGDERGHYLREVALQLV